MIHKIEFNDIVLFPDMATVDFGDEVTMKFNAISQKENGEVIVFDADHYCIDGRTIREIYEEQEAK